jgi:hypothetical protein
MKSLPIGKARTSCRDCVFAEYDGKRQSGCEFNRLEVFQAQGRLVEAHDDFKEEFNVINGFCNYNRLPTWIAEHNLDMDQANERVKLECEANVGLVVYDTPSETSNLTGTVSSIRKLRGDKRKIKIVISSFVERGVSELVTYVNELKADGFPAEAVINAPPLNTIDRDFDAFSKCKGYMYFGLLEHNCEVNPDLFNIINTSLNVKLERITMFEGEGVTVIPFSIVNSEYPDHQDYRKMVDHIRTLSQQQESYVRI